MDFTYYIKEAGAVAAALAALAGVLWAVVRFAVLRPLDRRIQEATKPIQPGYHNGGDSLADVSRKVRDLGERFERLEEAHLIQDERHIQVIEHLLELRTVPKRATARRKATKNSEGETS